MVAVQESIQGTERKCNIVHATSMVACVYNRMRRFKTATLKYKDAQKLAESTFGYQHAIYAQVLFDLAVVHANLEDLDAAKLYGGQSKAIFQMVEGAESK